MKINDMKESNEFTLPLRYWSTLSAIVVLHMTIRIPPIIPSSATKISIIQYGIGIAHISIAHAHAPTKT